MKLLYHEIGRKGIARKKAPRKGLIDCCTGFTSRSLDIVIKALSAIAEKFSA